MNRILLPPRGAVRRNLMNQTDERGIPIPNWWTDDDRDSSVTANMLLSTQMRQGTLARR